MNPKILKLGLGILFACVIVGYGLFRFYDYLAGPEIILISPYNGQTATSSVVIVQGKVVDAVYLSIDGSIVSPDENGSFEDTLLLPQGLSILTLEAKDRFGATIIKNIQLYVPENLVNQNVSTTTN